MLRLCGARPRNHVTFRPDGTVVLSSTAYLAAVLGWILVTTVLAPLAAIGLANL